MCKNVFSNLQMPILLLCTYKQDMLLVKCYYLQLYDIPRLYKSGWWTPITFQIRIVTTGTPPLMQLFGPWKNRVKGKPHYRRSILVLKPQNGEYISSKSTFLLVFTSVKLQSLHLYLFFKVKKDLMLGF